MLVGVSPVLFVVDQPDIRPFRDNLADKLFRLVGAAIVDDQIGHVFGRHFRGQTVEDTADGVRRLVGRDHDIDFVG